MISRRSVPGLAGPQLPLLWPLPALRLLQPLKPMPRVAWLSMASDMVAYFTDGAPVTGSGWSHCRLEWRDVAVCQRRERGDV